MVRLAATARPAESHTVVLADPPTGKTPPERLHVGILPFADCTGDGFALRVELSDWNGNSLGMLEEPLREFVAGKRQRKDLVLPKCPEGRNYVSYECSLVRHGRPVYGVKRHETSWTRPLAERRISGEKRPDLPWGIGAYLYRTGDFLAFGPGYGHADDEAAFARMEKRAALAAAAGFRWVRSGLDLPLIVKDDGTFDFTFFDRMFDVLDRYGLSICASLAPGRLKGVAQYTPEFAAAYADIVRKIVERYRGRIHEWEIWNDPNIHFWRGEKEDYPKFVNVVGKTIRDADPSAKIVAASTCGIDFPFIDMCRDQGMVFDTLSVHPYRGNPVERTLLRELAAVTNRTAGAKLYVTEFGWPTGTGEDVYSEREQAAYYARYAMVCAGSDMVHSLYGYNVTFVHVDAVGKTEEILAVVLETDLYNIKRLFAGLADAFHPVARAYFGAAAQLLLGDGDIGLGALGAASAEEDALFERNLRDGGVGFEIRVYHVSHLVGAVDRGALGIFGIKLWGFVFAGALLGCFAGVGGNVVGSSDVIVVYGLGIFNGLFYSFFWLGRGFVVATVVVMRMLYVFLLHSVVGSVKMLVQGNGL